MQSQILAASLAFVAPLLISFLKNVQWSVKQKQALAIGVAIALSFLAALIEIDDYWANFGNNVWVTIGMVEVSYAYLWERLKIPKVGNIEAKLRIAGSKSG